MASGKRASMREGPLAALFRRTDEPAEEEAREERPPAAPPAAARAAAGLRARAARAAHAPILSPSAPRSSRPPPASRRPRARPVPPPRRARSARPRTRATRAIRIRRSASTPPPVPEPDIHVPTPQERLRHAFSSDIPENILEPPAEAPAPVREAPRTAPDEPTGWGESRGVGHPVLRVVGVGGAGVNAVNRMVEAQVEGVEFLAINTDLQSLQQSTADITLHIGPQVTRGLGAGSDPELGRAAASDDYDRIKALLKGSDMVFIAAGAGGGTGTGAAPVVARIAREIGALTVGIVTRPFEFEGSRRAQAAETGVDALGARGRHADRRAQQPPADRARQAHVDGRRLPRGRRRPAPGRAGRVRPGHAARA